MTVNAAMPYNTRRKSLYLPSLGIHVPVSHGSRASQAYATSSASHRHHLSPSTSIPASLSVKRVLDPSLSQPSKKAKRSHCPSSIPNFDASNIAEPNTAERTPPPSPVHSTTAHAIKDGSSSIDLKSINDDIVEAVIVQLQATGNRPHLVKELSAVLMQKLRIVQQSANPAAIISSRLAAYLKRPCWATFSTCPIAKELETVHPRRTYFYLTTCPAQPFVGDADTKLMMPPARVRPMVTTPSISDEDEEDRARRRQLSPSPEVDLSSPEFDDFDDDQSQPATPVGSHARSGRAPSPALEKDEREFTQTFAGLQKRKLTGNLLEPVSVEVEDPTRDDSILFGEPRYTVIHQQILFTSSPAIRPSLLRKDNEVETWTNLDGMLEWDKSPENVELEELDGLFDQF